MNFTMGSIVLTGSSKITGDTATNSIVPGSVDFAWSTQIKGNLFVGPGVDWTTVVESAQPNPRGNVTGAIANLPSVREYRLMEFPQIPELDSKGSLAAGYWPAGPHVVGASGYYSSIEVTSSLTVNVGEEDVVIAADKLKVTGSGNILVNRTGGGKLILYVKDELQIAGSGRINSGGNRDAVILYYAGSSPLNLGGSTSITGTVFTKSAGIALSGSASIKGHVVTGGPAVDLSGNAEISSGVLYAPNAALTLAGSGKVKEVVVAGAIRGTGNAQIIFDNAVNLDFLENSEYQQ